MIREAARKTQGIKTLWEDGVNKILKGITSIDEVTKATFGDEL